MMRRKKMNTLMNQAMKNIKRNSEKEDASNCGNAFGLFLWGSTR
jgi:hypothetical protein